MAKRRPHEKLSRHECEAPFIQLPLSLIGGVTWNASSITARRALDRLIAEHLKHGAKENGRLRVSYRKLAEWTGASEGNISAALNELVDLGLVTITKGERPAASVKEPPNIYRLTFLPDHEDAAPTDEWRRWEPSKGADEAGWRAAAKRARNAAKAARERRRFRTEAEAEAAVQPSEALLNRLGKKKKGGPGNKHTRAALNEVNAANNSAAMYSFHPTQDGVEPPHAGWCGKGRFRPTQDGVRGHTIQDGASSISTDICEGSAAMPQVEGQPPPNGSPSSHADRPSAASAAIDLFQFNLGEAK